MIGAELTALLEPLDRFEAIRRRVARLGGRLCDLSYANFYGGVHEATKQILRNAVNDNRELGLQYAPFGGHTLPRRAVADALRSSHALPFTFSDVILTPGAMAALQLALHAVGGPGDEVLIPVPCWLDYPLYAISVGLFPRLVPVQQPSFQLDLSEIERAVTPRTCAILLSTPNNPTGRATPPNVIRELARLLRTAERKIGCRVTVITDETHRDFSPSGGFSSIASTVDNTLIIYSFGKRNFIQGQRLGYVTVSPRHPARREVAQELVQWTRITGIATPTALMQRAIPALLTLETDVETITTWRTRLAGELTDFGYQVVDADATMFLYVRTPAGWDDLEFVEEMASKGVLVLPAECFHHRGYFRLALTASEQMLQRALPIFRTMASLRAPTSHRLKVGS